MIPEKVYTKIEYITKKKKHIIEANKDPRENRDTKVHQNVLKYKGTS